MKNLIIAITLFLGAIFCLFKVYNLFKHEGESYTLCGKIKYTTQVMDVSKYSVHNDPMFVVVFEDGSTKEIEPTWDDFFTYKVGDRICYTYLKDYLTKPKIATFTAIATIFTIIGVVLILTKYNYL